MQTGELTESVRKRSVYRELHLNTVGKSGQEGRAGVAASLTGPLPGYADMPWRQVTAAVNSLAADGFEGGQLCLQGILPEGLDESVLREHMKQFAAEAQENGLFFYKTDLQVSDQVTTPQYFVTAIGKPLPESVSLPKREEDVRLRPGQELIIVRPIALAGTAALARAYEEKLRNHFPDWLIDRAKDFDRWMSVTEEARAVFHYGAYPMYCIAQGGIFSALWEMAEQAGVGLEVDLRKIPVKQETIEICEYLDVNPYYLYSAGALLVGTGQAETLVEFFQRADIPASVIGSVTDKNDRMIYNGENRRFLDRPKRDELWRISRA